jgi:hypothetical protein
MTLTEPPILYNPKTQYHLENLNVDVLGRVLSLRYKSVVERREVPVQNGIYNYLACFINQTVVGSALS